MLAHYTSTKVIVAELITPDNFAKFGGVISSKHQLSTAQSSSANYGTATKLFQVSPIENKHSDAQANFNLFRCSPPTHLIDDHQEEDAGLTYPLKILERHPFSTQTFLPMGRPKDDISYMVIVAPSDATDPEKKPIIDQTEAFVVRGDQAVTYGAGTWHAPMIALGDVTDFAVLIHETGDASKDTEEVSIDTLTVEFTMNPPGDSPAYETERTAQTQAEFDEQKELYTKEGPPNVSVNSAVGDKSFDRKQIKYAAEREYYARNYQKSIDLIDAHPVEDPKLQSELNEIKRRAGEKAQTMAA